MANDHMYIMSIYPYSYCGDVFLSIHLLGGIDHQRV